MVAQSFVSDLEQDRCSEPHWLLPAGPILQDQMGNDTHAQCRGVSQAGVPAAPWHHLLVVEPLALPLSYLGCITQLFEHQIPGLWSMIGLPSREA